MLALAQCHLLETALPVLPRWLGDLVVWPNTELCLAGRNGPVM